MDSTGRGVREASPPLRIAGVLPLQILDVGILRKSCQKQNSRRLPGLRSLFKQDCFFAQCPIGRYGAPCPMPHAPCPMPHLKITNPDS
ncbi:MAG: hypothetical protein F6J93_20910 [Oscillatoria sp. SIO1A7]|nr:hypothetical protein [Oscillatoria sp. SIO1A7]